MKILPYILGASMLISGIDVACPRCRRALPKGPRKLPHPGFPKKENNRNSVVQNTHGSVQRTDTKEKVNESK
jgi:hypothetical protein